MPIGPDEASRLTEEDKAGLKKVYEILDEKLRKMGGQELWINPSVLPPMNSKQRDELIHAYKKAGWFIVQFDSDRDGPYLRICK